MDERQSAAEFLRKSFERPTVRLDESTLERLVALSELDGVDLAWWQTKGIPVPDVSWGVWKVQPRLAPEVFKILQGLGYYHWWFPRGIPVIDLYEVHVANEVPERF